MGQLRIRVIEGKGIEQREGGFYFSFKLSVSKSSDSNNQPSSPLSLHEKHNTVARTKSKAFKKNEKWSDTVVTLDMPSNNMRGTALKLSIREPSTGSGWVKLKSARQPPIGEVSIPLDDLVSGTEKTTWVTLSPSGNLHLCLEHRVDNKCKLMIAFDKEPPRLYELLRDVKLSTQIDAVCQTMKAPGNCSDYVLQVEKTWVVITKEHLLDPKFTLPDKCAVNLIINPTLQVQRAIEAMNDPNKRKKTIFDLKTQLENAAFTQAFIAANGIPLISTMILETTGNTLAYALAVLDFCMNYGLGLDTISVATIEKIASLLLFKEANVRTGALKAAVHLSESKTHGYPAINAAIAKLQREKFFAEVAKLNLQKEIDVSAQSLTLTFFNRMLAAATPQERRLLIERMEEGDTSMMAKDLLETGDSLIKKQLSDYMIHRYELFIDKELYSKENPIHEKMLMELWDTVFPDIKLENRVSKEWAKLGFQGMDPATDFRALGVTSLKFMLYSAKNHHKLFRGIVDKQIDNGTTYFPVAVASINLMNMLFNLLKDLEGEQLTFMKIMYDQKFAIEEMFVICLELFDRMWIESGLDYMGFSEVISNVTDQVANNLTKVSTVQEFKTLCQTPLEKEERKTTRTRKKTINSPVVSTLRKAPKTSSAQSTLKRGTIQEHQPTLHEVVKSGDTKQVLNRIRNGANVNEFNENGISPLHMAISDNNLDMVRLLLWKDANVNIKTEEGWTPLHEACKKGSIEMCDILIGKGADVKAETSEFMTPLHYLASRRFEDTSQQLDVIHEMISKGGNVNSNRSSHQETPLHAAAQAGQADVCKFLVQHGADINLYSRSCFTALHFAIQGNHLPVVKILLENGADSGFPSKELTCLEMARDKPSILDFLLQYPSKQPIIPPRRGTNTGGESPSSSPTISSRGAMRGEISLGSRRGNANGTVSVISERISERRSPAGSMTTSSPLMGGRAYQRKSFFPALEVETTHCNFFHPGINETQAEELLAKSGKGSFLFRESDVRGSVIMSLFPTNGEIQHFIVLFQNAVGFQIQGSDDTTWYTHLSEMPSKASILKDLSVITNEESIESLLDDENRTQSLTSSVKNSKDNSRRNSFSGSQPTPPQISNALSASFSDLSKLTSLTTFEDKEKKFQVKEVPTNTPVDSPHGSVNDEIQQKSSMKKPSSPRSQQPPSVTFVTPVGTPKNGSPTVQRKATVNSAAAAAVQATEGLRNLFSKATFANGGLCVIPILDVEENSEETEEKPKENELLLREELTRAKNLIDEAFSQLNEQEGKVTEETREKLISLIPGLQLLFDNKS